MIPNHNAEVMWITSLTGLIGIVKRFDEIEGCWKYYIGCGNGRDMDEDIQQIVDYGRKFYSLDFIATFQEDTHG